MSLDQNYRGDKIVLPEIMNLSEVSALVEQLRAVSGSDVTIDASRVSLLGASCAQVLISAVKTWRADGYNFELQSRSLGFCEGLRLLGIPDTLEIGV